MSASSPSARLCHHPSIVLCPHPRCACLSASSRGAEGRKASLGRIFVFDPSLFVLATSGRGERETFSVPISTCLLSVFPSGRTEYQSEAAPNNQGLRHNLVFRHAIPWERWTKWFCWVGTSPQVWITPVQRTQKKCS